MWNHRSPLLGVFAEWSTCYFCLAHHSSVPVLGTGRLSPMVWRRLHEHLRAFHGYQWTQGLGECEAREKTRRRASVGERTVVLTLVVLEHGQGHSCSNSHDLQTSGSHSRSDKTCWPLCPTMLGLKPSGRKLF